MPKAILEFNLPEESDEFSLAAHGADWRYVVSTLDEVMRRHLKYGSQPEWDSATVESIRTMLHEVVQEESLTLNE